MDGRIARSFAESCAWTPRADKAGARDALGLIAEQSRGRIADLVPLRYERMAASVFSFFRGAALPMTADLSTLRHTGLFAQLAGDAHIGNFGIFASPSRRLVFDLNDFDETLRGPWEWDLLRLAASIEVCARERGFSRRERNACVQGCAWQYQKAMAEFARMGSLDVWYARFDVEDAVSDFSHQLSKHQSKTLRRAIEKARERTNARAVAKLCERRGSHLKIVSDPPRVRSLAECVGFTDSESVYRALVQLFESYASSLPAAQRHLLSQYRLEDIGQKVVGVGSVGLRCWVAVFSGRDLGDPLVLQIKEAGESVLARYLPSSAPTHAGERVVEGQRLMQSASDILLGWAATEGSLGGSAQGASVREYYVRQMWDAKGSIDLDDIGPTGLEKTARLAAWTLARAHARTGDRVAIARLLDAVGEDEFCTIICAFASGYADQNELDYRAFLEAREHGAI